MVGQGHVISGKPTHGAVSVSNNSTTALSAGATFTGVGEQNGWADVMVSCFSDQDGTLFIDFSNDGVTWRTFPTNGFTVTANIHEFHTAVKGPRHCRVRFTCGSVDQTDFELYTYFGNFKQPNAPLNQALGLDADALLVRPTFPWLDLGRGLVTGMSSVKKFGKANVDTSYTPIVSGGDYLTPTTAQSIEFVSSSSADALNGAGMHELTIEGLDENWELQTVATAAHATDGTQAVAVSGSWFRIFRAYVSSSGTYATSSAGSHVGTITVRIASAGATFLNIPLDNSFPLGQSFCGAYTIPINKTGYVFLTDITVEAGKTVSVVFFQRDQANDVTSSFGGTMRAQSALTGLTSGVPVNLTGNLVPFGPYTGPCDIGFMAYVSAGSTGDVSVEFEIILVDE